MVNKIRNGPLLAIIALVGVLGYRYFRFISDNAVNIFYFDQWDFLTPFFDGNPGIIRLYLLQHGPHREGVGLIADKFLYPLTHWSARAESFLIGACVFGAMILAVLLKHKLFGRLSYSDAAIPLIFLTLMQYETFVGTPNPAYSGFPLLLQMLYCLALLQRRFQIRIGLLLAINFALVYTGLGLFMGVVTVGVFGLTCYWRLRGFSADSLAYSLASLVLACASLGSFFIHYTFLPAVDCYVFPVAQPISYFWFMALMFSTFLGPTRPVLLVTAGGAAALLVAAAILMLQINRFRTEDASRQKPLVIAVLLSYVMVLSANTAVGRVCLGLPDSAQASRYTTLLIPGYLAFYFYLLSRPANRFWRVAMVLFLTLIIPGAVTLPGAARRTTDGKRAWAACFVRTGDVAYCDQSTGFTLHPRPQATGLEQKLNFLRTHRLSLFFDAAASQN